MPLNKLFDKPMQIVLRPVKTMTTTAEKMTRMAPSSGSKTSTITSSSSNIGVDVGTSTCLGATASDAFEENDKSRETNVASNSSRDRCLPRLDPQEPNLHCIPKDLYPEYRPLPLPVKLLSVVLSMWVSAVTTWKHLTWFQPLAVFSGMRPSPTIREWIFFAAKTLLFTVFSHTVLQDLFLPPSRISTENLQGQYFLPSPLSNYKQITINDNSSLGVHFLKYDNKEEGLKNFDALYVLHGFGASSLSWLPPLPLLVEKIGAKVGLGHDAVGFGFTDRPEDVALYTTGSSASIGTQLLKDQVGSDLNSVAIFGHSLGALTALKMALQMPKETSKLVILVAPALGIRKTPPKRTGEAPWISRKVLKPVRSIVRKAVFYPIGGYALRRVVGAKGFWKSGLRFVWGDPDKVQDSDALRFQWPAVGKGWERGLLDFARAQALGDPDEVGDISLLRKVLDLPNTTVAIVLGSNDRVIPKTLSKKFLRDFPDVPVINLDGLGHDAFEEDIDQFLYVSKNMLLKFKAMEG